MPKEPERLEIDIQKIFLTPPTSMREKITLFLMMLVIFIMCFGPTIFTDISPVRAVIVSAIPALPLSAGTAAHSWRDGWPGSPPPLPPQALHSLFPLHVRTR